MYCPSTTTSFDVVDVIKKVGGAISKSASEVQTTARYRKRYAEKICKYARYAEKIYETDSEQYKKYKHTSGWVGINDFIIGRLNRYQIVYHLTSIFINFHGISKNYFDVNN